MTSAVNSSLSDDFVLCDTTQQHKTHISKYQEVYYPWHPWYGCSVLVRGSLTRRDRVVFRCTIEDDAANKNLEVPQWMFDRAVCCGMRLVDTPVLRVHELRSLKALLGHVTVTTGGDLRQDQHCLLTPKGNVDAKTAKSSPRSSTGSISSCRSSISICVKVQEHESGGRERKLVHAASRQAYRRCIPPTRGKATIFTSLEGRVVTTLPLGASLSSPK